MIRSIRRPSVGFAALGASFVAAFTLACGSEEPTGAPAGQGDPGDAGTQQTGGDGGAGDGSPTVSRACVRGAQQRVSAAPGDSLHPTLAAGPGGAAVIWDDARTEPVRAYFATLDPTAKPSPEVLIPWTSSSAVTTPSVAWGGAGWLATWVDGNKLYARPFDATSAPVGDLVELAIPAQGYTPTIVGTGAGYGVVWTTGTQVGPDGDLYFAALDQQGAFAISPVKVTASAFKEFVPQLAWNGTTFGLLWVDTRGAEPQLGFRELDALGQPKGEEKFLASGVDNVVSSSLVWTGDGYATAWYKDSAQHVALLDASGNLAKGPKTIPTPKGSPRTLAVASLAWRDGRLGAAYQWRDTTVPNARPRLYFVELDGDLDASSGIIEVVTTQDGALGHHPSMVPTKDGYMLAWVGAPAWDVYANTITCR